MNLIEKIRWFRLIERTLVTLVVALTAVGVWAVVTHSIPQMWIYIFFAVLVVLVAILLIVAVKLDSKMALVAAQANFSVSDEFASLYERSPTAYFTIDREGLIVNFNQAAVHLLESTSVDMTRNNFFALLSSSTEIDASVAEGKIKAGMTMNDVEVALYTAQGREIWTLMSVYPDKAQDQRLISLVDITQAKKVDTAKSEFVALATHQLRTPIAAIRWNVELLEKKLGDAATEDQARYLEKIERNVLRMLALINDFLSVSKLEMGTFAANIQVLDVTAFFDSILEEFSEKITQKNLTIDRSDDPPNTTIRTDDRLFHIIVSNLVSNAVKYLQPNGVLALKYTVSGDRIIITVADNGIGIPSSEVPRLFEKFYRASNARKHQTEGTGLGLYIVQQSVEQLKGTIGVTSEEDQGAVFTVNLPLAM